MELYMKEIYLLGKMLMKDKVERAEQEQEERNLDYDAGMILVKGEEKGRKTDSSKTVSVKVMGSL